MIHCIDIYHKYTHLVHIEWDTDDQTHTIYCKAFTDKHIKLAKEFYNDTIKFSDITNWMEGRVIPRYRHNIDIALKQMGLREYNPFQMCKITHGVRMGDFIWIRFDNEDITYDDVKIRE